MEQDVVEGSVAELVQLGRMGLELGYREQAEAYFSQALQQAPRDPDALMGKARAMRDTREALRLVRVVLQDRPGDHGAATLAAELSRRIDDEERALAGAPLPGASVGGGASAHPEPTRSPNAPQRSGRSWLVWVVALNVILLVLVAALLAFGGSLIGGRRDELDAPEPTVAAEPAAGVPVVGEGVDDGMAAVALRKAEFAIALIIVPVPNSTRVATGSGSVITSDGLVLTNYHVVANDAMTELANPDGLAFVGLTRDARAEPDEWYIAAVVASDVERDLAVLRILNTTDGQMARTRRFQPVTMADSTTLALGQQIVALGYPTLGGATITLTRGSMAGFVTEEGVRYGKTDSELLPGSSGGAVLDEQGRMVGIITGAMTEARTQGRLSYFVLANEARDVIAEARNARAPRVDVQWMVDTFAKLDL